MPTFRFILAMVAASAAIVAIAGCGGDDDESASSGNQVASEGSGTGEAGGESGSARSSEEGTEGSGAAGGGSVPGGSGELGIPGGGEAGGAAGGGASGGNGSLGGANAKGGSGSQRAKGTGGGAAGGGAGGAAENPDNAAFFQKADEICREYRAKTRDGLGPYAKNGITSIAKNAGAIVSELVIPNLEGEMGEISDLPPPASAQAAVDALFNSINEMIAAAEADAETFILGSEAVDKSEAIAKENGFNLCGGI